MLSGSGKNQFIRQKNIELNTTSSVILDTDAKQKKINSHAINNENHDECNKTTNNSQSHEDDDDNTIQTLNELVEQLDFNGINLNKHLKINNNNNNEHSNYHQGDNELVVEITEKNSLFKFPSNTNLNQSIRIETSPSSSSASSSPCTLASATASPHHHQHIETYNSLSPNRCSLSPQSTNNINQSSSSSSVASLSNLTSATGAGGSNSNLSASSLSAILNKNATAGSKIQISHNLKQKLTKAATGPSSSSCSSNTASPKQSHTTKPRHRLGNLMGFSVGSFFSKSLNPNEDNNNNINSSSPENDHSNLMPMTENSNEINRNIPQPSSSSSRAASKSRDGSRPRKFGKSILALSVFSSYNHSKLKKNAEASEASSVVQASSKNTSEIEPPISANDASLSMENSAVIGSTESPPKSTRNISLMLTKSSTHSKSTEIPSTSNKKMIGSFEVDLEKLARELVLPSINAPLTSFNTNDEEVCSTTANNNNLIKPPLLPSKTIDASNNLKFPNKAAMMQRSLTNNK